MSQAYFLPFNLPTASDPTVSGSPLNLGRIILDVDFPVENGVISSSDFTNATADDQGHTWQNISPTSATLSVSGGKAHSSAGNADFVVDTGASDGTISVVSDSAGSGLTLGTTDSSNFARAAFGSFFENIAGTLSFRGDINQENIGSGAVTQKIIKRGARYEFRASTASVSEAILARLTIPRRATATKFGMYFTSTSDGIAAWRVLNSVGALSAIPSGKLPVLVVITGNSRTQGVGASNVTQSYPVVAMANFPNADFVRWGVAGYTYAQMLAQFQSTTNNFPGYASDYAGGTRIVHGYEGVNTLNFAYNGGSYGTVGGVTDLATLTTYVNAQAKAYWDYVYASGYICAPGTVSYEDDNFGTSGQRSDTRTVIDAHNTYLRNQVITGTWGSNAFIVDYMSNSTGAAQALLHPNDATYAAMATVLTAALNAQNVNTFVTPIPPPTVLVGSNAVAPTSDYIPLGFAGAYQFVAANNGTAGNFYCYIYATPPTTLKCAIYSDDGSDNPSTKLGEATFGTLIGGWNSVAFPAVSIVAGTKYWLAFLPTGSRLDVKITSGGTGPQSGITTSSFPSTWGGTGGGAVGPVSVYVTS